MTTPTTLTLLGGAAVLLSYLYTRIAAARRAAEIRVRVEDRRSARRFPELPRR